MIGFGLFLLVPSKAEVRVTVSLLVAGPDYATLTIHATNNHNIDNLQTLYSAQSGRFFANALSVMHLGFIRQSVAARWATCGRARQGLWHPTQGLWHSCPGAMGLLPKGYGTPTLGL